MIISHVSGSFSTVPNNTIFHIFTWNEDLIRTKCKLLCLRVMRLHGKKYRFLIGSLFTFCFPRNSTNIFFWSEWRPEHTCVMQVTDIRFFSHQELSGVEFLFLLLNLWLWYGGHCWLKNFFLCHQFAIMLFKSHVANMYLFIHVLSTQFYL